MTKRLAIMGSILAAIVFVTTLTRPATSSEWPMIAQAALNAAGAFITVWLVIPLMAYIAYVALTPVRKALRRFARPDA